MALLLQLDDVASIKNYLIQHDWAAPETELKVALAGEGNMNLTLRVQQPAKSIILKQSRAWVEKYPDIAAPEQRIAVEASFYQSVQEVTDVAEAMPALLHFDGDNRIAWFEDLGTASDLSTLYQGGDLSTGQLQQLLHWLSALHRVEVPAAQKQRLQNRDMRQLNHEHIFHLPLLADNGLDLDEITPGLANAANQLKENALYINQVAALGQRYLADGNCLLHGDFYPGSWLATAQGLKVIDAEFAFLGQAEFDVGVLIAHFYLAGCGDDKLAQVWQFYQADAGFSRPLAMAFAGVEIMRRLMGVAQLPLEADLETKQALLALSQQWVLA